MGPRPRRGARVDALTQPGRWEAVREAALDELAPRTLFAMLRLRTDVFVVEQACAYPELDDHDAAPTTRHCWVEGEDGAPLAYLRLIRGEEPQRIGRVVTAPAARGRGLAARLLSEVLGRNPGTVVLDAQSHLRGMYERLGFVVVGEEFVEDGIPHLPMRRG